MSEDAHKVIMAFPEFITECRGDVAVKVEMLLLNIDKNSFFTHDAILVQQSRCLRV